VNPASKASRVLPFTASGGIYDSEVIDRS